MNFKIGYFRITLKKKNEVATKRSGVTPSFRDEKI